MVMTPATTKILRLTVLAALCGLVAAGCARIAPPAATHESHWTYSGITGPTEWGRLDGAFAQCGTGLRQSPVDLDTATSDPADTELRVSYNPARASIANNGHTVQATFENAGTLAWGDQQFRLLQLHYHRPSEHTINGKPADLEVHLVNRSANGDLVVVGVLFDQGVAADSMVAALIRGGLQHGSMPIESVIDPRLVVPDVRSYFTYEGSLTTPPCSEPVRWIVLRDRRVISPEQLHALERMLEPNARPVMPLGDRRVLARTESR
jgi:carbonic anhydrase